MSRPCDQLALKYIRSTEKALQDLVLTTEDKQETTLDTAKVDEIIDHAKRYLEDAKHYLSRNMYETALASVAYSEGILDALKLLNLVKFDWPKQQ
jgi:FAD synthetase